MNPRSLILFGLLLLSVASEAQLSLREDASSTTTNANATVAVELPFANAEDFALADRGLIARPSQLVIRDAAGRVVWDMHRFQFAEGEAPATVNPSLWRQAKLNSRYGLYKIAERIYQVRGFDITNLSIIVGDTGYIVVDPLLTAETARAAMAFVRQHLPDKPIVAVIYSHSHADHFGGVKGIVSQQEVDDGKVRVIASDGFMKFATSENILAGNVMGRRASYMFGSLLARDEKGLVDAGLGKAVSTGEITLIEPTQIITDTDREIEVDGVRFVVVNTPFAEAPAEFIFYLPQMKAFYAAEEANGTLHNLYTMRGAEVRDALLWSQYLHDAINLIPAETEVLFGGHHWPRWGYEQIVEYLQKQGDAYKYIHDQTLRLANHGYTMNEISEQLEFPDELGHAWYNRGYYGTVSHNSRAVYQKYLGFFDGNPANIEPLPPEEAGKRYVDLIGGADELLAKARVAFDAGEYRWVAEVVNHLVFAEPDNIEAKNLQAEALEQLGYQAESGQWRNFYLTGASELRDGVQVGSAARPVRSDIINALTLNKLFDYLAVRLNGPAAAGKRIVINFDFEDTGDQFMVTLVNGVLHHVAGKSAPEAHASVRLGRAGFLAMSMRGVPVESLIASDAISVNGDVEALNDLLAMLDSFEFWFDIVTP